ncbi:hypothetical protein F5890DRAFT_477028 [Lentinula detonsa]|uniref:Uncharacterized protein n=1 Tax=Lentinula detonsa TaxID=2804962 RepID=A0AA38PTX4_9AGAR|nr:hypothetical protein F5890DRAFT_477028 [Lentinula detonsa]
MSDSATPKPVPAAREWGRNNDGAGPVFNGLGRAKRGGGSGRGTPRGGRGAGRGGASFRGRGRGRGSGGNGETTTTTTTTTNTAPKPAETASKSSPTTSKVPSKSSETNTTPKNPLGKSGARKRSSAKAIPQITVPPPSTTSTTITDEINALVEHVRAGALTPNGPITPFTPSHIDWAGDEEEDGSLPDLNDWGVSASSEEPPNDAERLSTAESTINAATKTDAISPILVDGLKSLPEPKVPEHREPEAEAKSIPPLPSPGPLPSKQVLATSSDSTSYSLHPSLPAKPNSNPKYRPSKEKPAVAGNIRGGSITRPPRSSRGSRNNLTATQPDSEPSHDTDSKNSSKPVSGGVSLSAPTPSSKQSPAAPTLPESLKKGLTDSIHAPRPVSASTEPVQSKAGIPAPLNVNGSSASKAGSYVPPHRNSRPTFVPTPAPPPSANGGLTAEFTFPSLSPSPISGHYPTGPRGPGGGSSESGGLDRHHANYNGGNGAFNGNGNGRNTFNPRNNNFAPRHYQQDPNHSTSQFPRDRQVYQPQTQSHHSDPLHTRTINTTSPHHTPRHTPHHSREHSASRPVITGDAISKLARTIAGSPAKS